MMQRRPVGGRRLRWLSVPGACLLSLTAGPASAQGRLSGTVYDSLRAQAPLAGALVQVEGLAQMGLTDARGRFEIPGVPTGRRIITFFHPMLDSLGLSAPIVAVAVPAEGLQELRLALPSFATLGRAMCGAALDSATAIVIGRVREVETGEPLAGAEAEVEWVEMSFGDGSRLTPQRRRSAAVATASGDFLLCGVPTDIDAPLVVRMGEATTGLVDLLLDGSSLVSRDVSISLRDPASRRPVSARGDSLDAPAVPGLARLRAVVRDDAGRPLRDALVGVRGSPVAARTDSAGAAVLLGLPSGSQTLRARTVGRAPSSVVVALRPEATAEVELRLDSAQVVLADFVVRGIRQSPALEAFERRRRSGAGYFLDAQELERRGRGIAALRGTPGLFLDNNGSFYPDVRMRSASGRRCQPTILMDGFPLPRVQSWEIEGLLRDAVRVEVYSRPLSAPIELITNRDCGAIGIWSY